MRKLIRKIIKERIEGFDDFDNLDIDLLDDTDMEEEKKQVSVYAYSSLIYKAGTHRIIPAMHHFATLEDMKYYISTWDGTNCTQHPYDYSIHLSVNPAYLPEPVHKELFNIFPHADSIKINVFDDKEFIDFDGKMHMNKADAMCKYVQYYEGKKIMREIHIFSNSEPPVLSGYYLLQKNGGITYTPKI